MSNESVYSGGSSSPMVIMQTMFKELQQNGTSGEYDLDLTKFDLHKIIYNIQKELNYPFKSFYFNGSKRFPFSQLIADVLYEMTVCGKLTRPNPTMAKYNFVSLSDANYDGLEPLEQKAVDSFVNTITSQKRP